MDPVLQQLMADFAVAAARTSYAVVRETVEAAKATDNKDSVIAAQDELLNRLIADKNDLVRMGNSLRDQFVAQQISSEQLEMLTSKVVPLLKKWSLAGVSDEDERAAKEAQFADVEELLDPELLEIAQVLGFNFKYAIGQALSELTYQSIVGDRSSSVSSPVGEPTPGSSPGTDAMAEAFLRSMTGSPGPLGFPGQGPTF